MTGRVKEGGLLLRAGECAWVQQWWRQLGVAAGRLRMHPVVLDAQHLAAAQVFGAAALPLRRFDFCVLPVRREALGWSRTALAGRCHAGADVPLLGLLDGLTAPAIQDLLQLGLDDFVLREAGADEFLARTCRLRMRAAAGEMAQAAAHPAADTTPVPLLAVCGIRYQHVSFQEAKRQVLGVFEREYLNLALEDAGGNVAAAARAVSKHRRAFWSLMQKHGVDANPYRARAAAARMAGL